MKYKVGVHFPENIIKDRKIDVAYYADRDEIIKADTQEQAVEIYIANSRTTEDRSDIGIKKGDFFWLHEREVQYVTAIPY